MNTITVTVKGPKDVIVDMRSLNDVTPRTLELIATKLEHAFLELRARGQQERRALESRRAAAQAEEDRIAAEKAALEEEEMAHLRSLARERAEARFAEMEEQNEEAASMLLERNDLIRRREAVVDRLADVALEELMEGDSEDERSVKIEEEDVDDAIDHILETAQAGLGGEEPEDDSDLPRE